MLLYLYIDFRNRRAWDCQRDQHCKIQYCKNKKKYRNKQLNRNSIGIGLV